MAQSIAEYSLVESPSIGRPCWVQVGRKVEPLNACTACQYGMGEVRDTRKLTDWTFV